VSFEAKKKNRDKGKSRLQWFYSLKNEEKVKENASPWEPLFG